MSVIRRRPTFAVPTWNRTFLLVVFLVSMPLLAAWAQFAAAEETPGALETLSIVTASGQHEFSVEVMRTDAGRERGLMFRRFLPRNRGMLFDFEVEQPVMMWMKNTYLPLDMIFIAESGRVVGIAADTEPLSERIIPSGAPAYAVLEVNAGTAARIALKIGDQVRHAMFHP